MHMVIILFPVWIWFFEWSKQEASKASKIICNMGKLEFHGARNFSMGKQPYLSSWATIHETKDNVISYTLKLEEKTRMTTVE